MPALTAETIKTELKRIAAPDGRGNIVSAGLVSDIVINGGEVMFALNASPQHMKAMEQLREGIGLRGYGQKDPKLEYKKEGYNIFADMIDRISQNVAAKLFRVQLEMRQPAQQAPSQPAASPEIVPEYRHKERRVVAQHPGVPILAMTPRGKPLTQARVRELAAGSGVVVLCGRFEGFDERIFEGRPIEQVSLGDIVLSGGEPAALALLDACIRLLPGVMGAPSSGAEESFEDDLLEYPHYTRPQEWEGRTIPEVLRSGDHAKIAAWRKQRAEDDTRLRRPDLWERHVGARAQSASGARRKRKDMDQ